MVTAPVDHDAGLRWWVALELRYVVEGAAAMTAGTALVYVSIVQYLSLPSGTDAMGRREGPRSVLALASPPMSLLEELRARLPAE